MPAMQPEKGASPSNRSRWLGSTDTSYCDRYFSLFEQATVQTEENQSRNKEMPSIIYFYFSKVIFLTSLSSLKKEMFRGGKRIPPWFCFFFLILIRKSTPVIVDIYLCDCQVALCSEFSFLFGPSPLDVFVVPTTTSTRKQPVSFFPCLFGGTCARTTRMEHLPAAASCCCRVGRLGSFSFF